MTLRKSLSLMLNEKKQIWTWSDPSSPSGYLFLETLTFLFNIYLLLKTSIFDNFLTWYFFREIFRSTITKLQHWNSTLLRIFHFKSTDKINENASILSSYCLSWILYISFICSFHSKSLNSTGNLQSWTKKNFNTRQTVKHFFSYFFVSYWFWIWFGRG